MGGVPVKLTTHVYTRSRLHTCIVSSRSQELWLKIPGHYR